MQNTIKKNGKFKWRTFKSKYSKRYNTKITDNLYLHRKYKKRIYKAICKSEVSDEKIYKYSGFAILRNYGKKIRVEFYSDGLVRKADEKLMYEVAKEDNIEQTVTIEGVIISYQHGRFQSTEDEINEPSMSIVTLQEWIIMDREILIQEFEKTKKD